MRILKFVKHNEFIENFPNINELPFEQKQIFYTTLEPESGNGYLKPIYTLCNILSQDVNPKGIKIK